MECLRQQKKLRDVHLVYAATCTLFVHRQGAASESGDLGRSPDFVQTWHGHCMAACALRHELCMATPALQLRCCTAAPHLQKAPSGDEDPDSPCLHLRWSLSWLAQAAYELEGTSPSPMIRLMWADPLVYDKGYHRPASHPQQQPLKAPPVGHTRPAPPLPPLQCRASL